MEDKKEEEQASLPRDLKSPLFHIDQRLIKARGLTSRGFKVALSRTDAGEAP